MRKNLFDFDFYKKYVFYWLKQMPKNGHGQLSRIAKHLGISSVSVSHIFNGPRDLTEEQAVELSDFFGFSDLEADYFLLLVQHERAATHKLKARVQVKLRQVREEAQNLKTRIKQDMELDESAKAQFYSNWFYSGLRLACDIDGLHRIETIAEYFKLPRSTVREVLEFLIQYGLVVRNDGLYYTGPKSTHLSGQSLLVSRHHINWRLKGMESMQDVSSQELFYTCPMTLSEETMQEIRKDLVDFIEHTLKKVDPSPSHQLACLNIDWFGVKGK